MEAFAGTVIGVRAFRVDATHVATTEGIYITQSAFHRIPSQILTGTGQDIYFDPSTQNIGLSENNTIPEGATIIINLAISGAYLNEHRDVQLEGLTGYSISIPNKEITWGWGSDDNTKHRFQGAGVYQTANGDSNQIGLFNANDIISRAWSYDGHVHRRHYSVMPSNFLFVPKGYNSPFIRKNRNKSSRTIYTCKLNKPSSS